MSASLIARNRITWIRVQINPQHVRGYSPSSCLAHINNALSWNAITAPLAHSLPANAESAGSFCLGTKELENFHGNYYCNQ